MEVGAASPIEVATPERVVVTAGESERRAQVLPRPGLPVSRIGCARAHGRPRRGGRRSASGMGVPIVRRRGSPSRSEALRGRRSGSVHRGSPCRSLLCNVRELASDEAVENGLGGVERQAIDTLGASRMRRTLGLTTNAWPVRHPRTRP